MPARCYFNKHFYRYQFCSFFTAVLFCAAQGLSVLSEYYLKGSNICTRSLARQGCVRPAPLTSLRCALASSSEDLAVVSWQNMSELDRSLRLLTTSLNGQWRATSWWPPQAGCHLPPLLAHDICTCIAYVSCGYSIMQRVHGSAAR
jgi:hypothetical protein